MLLKPRSGQNHPPTWRGAIQSSFCLCTPYWGTGAPQHADSNASESCRGLIRRYCRLATGFLVMDNSGPAAAENEFAASVMTNLIWDGCAARLFTADVAVEDQHEIVQDSSCMLSHSQGTFCRVVDFWINTTAPAVDQVECPIKKTKTTLHFIWYHRLASRCTNPKKAKKNAATRTRTCSNSSKIIT